ncbi:MAG: hypothetical protein HRT72_09445 [Flavobacteriales bacterium]|nr:hypothetical protein [Flavobacteriales bacterium]
MITYNFTFKGEKSLRFEVNETESTSIESPDQPIDEWLKLENGKCDGCEIPKGDRKTCPAALSIQPILSKFTDKTSHEIVKVTVEINDFEIHASMPAQNAVRSLMGLRLALSDCHIMKMLRPMASFHVPFGGIDHSHFRFVGMYLTGQYLRRDRGHCSNGNLSGLRDFINSLHNVNTKLSKRIALGTEKDTTNNSLVILDTLTSILKMDIDASLIRLKPYFKTYLE